jgi:hypothetical protein
LKDVKDWEKTTSHLYLGLYCPIFKLPISLPNIQTFSDNYKFFKNNVTGIFAQGYADIPGLQN